MEEIKESYAEQIDRLLQMGSIRDIVNDRVKLLQILTYNGDRHLIAFFYELLNGGLENGLVDPSDLEANIRSGWLARKTIELKDSLIGRDPYSFEVGDKINYASLLRDAESQIAMFTQPEIVGAIAGTSPNSGGELSYCTSSFYSWTIDAQLRLIEEVLKLGNREKALELLDLVNKARERSRKYEEEDRAQGRSGR